MKQCSGSRASLHRNAYLLQETRRNQQPRARVNENSGYVLSLRVSRHAVLRHYSLPLKFGALPMRL
jgi:hypothetical protein